MRLQGKTALVTGSARGIGRAIVVAFAREGARVAALDRDEQHDLPDNALALRGDLAREADVAAAVAQTRDAFGEIDILVNNAGFRRFGSLLGITVADFDEHLAVNTRGTFLMTKTVAQAMVDAGRSGTIINLTSIVAERPPANNFAYAVSKAAGQMIGAAAAHDLAPLGIRVVNLAPGPIVTEMTAEVRVDADRAAQTVAHIPLGRYGDAEEVATAAVFLASDDARFITGSTVYVDGGWMLR